MTGDWPHLGHGVGLRKEHQEEILTTNPQIDWFEVISENHMVPGGNPRRVLRRLRERYPVVMHGVSLSIGSTDPLNQGYLQQLRTLVGEVEPAWISDHLCWGSVDGVYAHDLLPLPFTDEALGHVVERVSQAQDHLGRRILLENVSSYMRFAHTTMPEWEFLAEVARRADCGILLDLNNVYVSAQNHGFDAQAYLMGLPPDRIGQYHLAGHSHDGALLIDTHDHPVAEPVWDLYQAALRLVGPRATLIEWDDELPALDVLLGESRRARQTEERALA